MFLKKRIVALALAAAMTTSLVLSSCNVTSSYPGTPDKNGVTIDIEAEPPKLNSIITSDEVSMNVLRHLVDGLTILDQNDKAMPGVADSWTISDDKLTYTFKLNKDYKWSNGEPVTAKDFEFSFKSLITPKSAAVYASMAFAFKNAQKYYNYAAYNEGTAEYKASIKDAPEKVEFKDVGIKAIDDYTFELKLEDPLAYLLDLLAFVVFLPVNEKAYTEFGSTYATEANNILTNGAYDLTSWAHEDKLVLTKNQDYPKKDDINIETISMKMFTDTNTRMNSFSSNEIDMVRITGDQIAEMKNKQYPTLAYDDGGSWYLQFNLVNPIFANQKLRQAMTYAVDSAAIVNNVKKNASKVAESMTPPAIGGNKAKFNEEVGSQFKSHDIEKAKQLVEEAKKELGVSEIKITLLCNDGNEPKAMAALMQENWKKDLNITVEVESVPFKSRLAKMEAGTFDLVLAGWSPDYNDPMTYLDLWESYNVNNYGKYNSAEYDKLIADSRKEPNRDKRFGLLMDAEKILMTDMPVGPLFFTARDYVLSEKLTGVVRTSGQSINMRWAKVK